MPHESLITFQVMSAYWFDSNTLEPKKRFNINESLSLRSGSFVVNSIAMCHNKTQNNIFLCGITLGEEDTKNLPYKTLYNEPIFCPVNVGQFCWVLRLQFSWTGDDLIAYKPDQESILFKHW